MGVIKDFTVFAERSSIFVHFPKRLSLMTRTVSVFVYPLSQRASRPTVDIC